MLGVSKGLVSRSLESLLQRGLIDFAGDVQDRRVRHIRLTEGAKTVTDRVKESIEEVNARLLADKVLAVFLAEPVADCIAVATTVTLFIREMKRI